MKKINILLLLLIAFPLFSQVEVVRDQETKQASVAQFQQVDYRYAPQWHVSCIGLPDDTCKTQIGPLGQLLTDYGKGNFFNYVGGYGVAIQFLADENMKFAGQRLYSARVPLVITEASYAGMKITQETFAVALDYIRNQVPTHRGNREDVILTTVSNPTNRKQTLNPVLIVNANYKQKTVVTDRTALIDGKTQVITDLKPALVRQNLVDFKTVITLEPVTVAPGETKQIIVLYDNGRPSVLADRLKSDAHALRTQINDIRAEMITYWETGSDIPYDYVSVPDMEIQNLIDASLRGIWQAREIKNDRIAFQVGPTRYRGLWVSDGASLLETATMFNRGAAAREGVEYTLTFQKDNGKFEIMEPTYWKENGIVLWTCVRHAMLTQDKAWLKSVWGKLLKSVDFIRELRAMTLTNDIPLDDGLIPPGQKEHSPRDLTPSNYVGDMPHNWASALFAGLAVHLLALDRGNELHLLEGFPPEWRQAGMKTSLKDIATPFGKLSFTLQVNAQGTEAALTVDALPDPSCKGIYVHLGDWGTVDDVNASLLRLDAKKANTVTIRLNKSSFERWKKIVELKMSSSRKT